LENKQGGETGGVEERALGAEPVSEKESKRKGKTAIRRPRSPVWETGKPVGMVQDSNKGRNRNLTRGLEVGGKGGNPQV